MRRRISFVLFAAAVVAACSSHGGPTSSAISPNPDQGLQPKVVRTAAPEIFVADHTANAVDAYSTLLGGDVSPVNTISGPDTQLGAPDGLAVGPDGSVYVANDAGSGSVTVYAPNATGDAVPVRTITCGGLDAPAGVSLDASGDLFVANYSGDSISVFSPTDNGCVSGNRVIQGVHTCLIRPRDVDLSPDGHILVASSSAVSVYRPSASGDAYPVQHIHGASTLLLPQVEGVSLDSAGNIYVTSWATNSNGRLTVYAPGATGNAVPLWEIAGSATTFGALRHVEIDALDQAWVTNGATVDVFAAGASGNVAPSLSISGSATGLIEPLGLDIF